MERKQSHPLLSRFDQDPGPWRPFFYRVVINVPVMAGQSEAGSITINNQPYIWTRLSSQIIGATGDPEGSGLYQDGQYEIEFKDQQSNYQAQPVPSAAAFGGPGQGFVVDLPFPVPYAGANTLEFRITNLVTRTLIPEADTFPVKIVMCGVAEWGELI